MIGENYVRMPLGANRDERTKLWTGGEVAPAGREVLLVNRVEPGQAHELDAPRLKFWQGKTDEFPGFDPAGDVCSFVYEFAPDGYKYRSVVEKEDWSRLLDRYGLDGELEEELRAEPMYDLFDAVFTCTRGDRICEGLVESYAGSMARLNNEMRRRIMNLPT